jgi:hypothetical protein
MTKPRTPTEGQQLEAALKALAMTLSELNRGGFERDVVLEVEPKGDVVDDETRSR